jgi:hypothetical protein
MDEKMLVEIEKTQLKELLKENMIASIIEYSDVVRGIKQKGSLPRSRRNI